MMAVQKRKLGAIAVILPAMLLAASSAWADSSAKSTDGSLPGVRQQQPIASHDGVYPPEPEPTEQANNGTDFNIGDMLAQFKYVTVGSSSNKSRIVFSLLNSF